MENVLNTLREIILDAERPFIQILDRDAEKTEHPFLVIPNDHKVEDLEKWLAAPLATREKINVFDREGFLGYVSRYKGPNTVIFADEREAKYTAIIDYAGKDDPQWGKHIVTYQVPSSDEWDTWHGNDRSQCSQVEFAEFLERNLVDVLGDSARLLEIASTLGGKRQIKFGSKVDLSNGSINLQYDDQVEGAAGKTGRLKVPEKFRIGIPFFVNGDKYEIDVRLRFRIKDAGLTIWYELDRPEELRKKAVEALTESIEPLKVPVFRGSRA